MRLLNTESNKWNKTLQFELTLKELQILRDSIACSHEANIKKCWLEANKEAPYSSSEFYQCYTNINTLTEQLGGNDFNE